MSTKKQRVCRLFKKFVGVLTRGIGQRFVEGMDVPLQTTGAQSKRRSRDSDSNRAQVSSAAHLKCFKRPPSDQDVPVLE